MIRIEQRAVLGRQTFPEIGRPLGVYWNQTRTLIAVTGTLWPQQWHGRSLTTRPADIYRIALYDARTFRRRALLRLSRNYPINDLSFHPTRPLLAVASGSYDGGYAYEGELLLWNFELDQVASVLDERREVTQCTFDETGSILRFTLRPSTDEEEPSGPLYLHTEMVRKNWEAVPERSVVVEQLPTQVMTGNDDEGYRRQEPDAVYRTLENLARAAGGSFEPRWHVWDVAWTAQNVILAVRNNTALEAWNLQGERLLHIPDAATGVQVVPSPVHELVYVNLFSGWDRNRMPGEPFTGAHVERIDLQTGYRERMEEIPFPAMLSMTSSGHVLVRDTEHERRGAATRDAIIAPDGSMTSSLNLGHYDLVNHYLRIDGASELYFLQSTPPTDYRDKWVCRIHPQSGLAERLFPLEWDQQRGAHLLSDGGTYLRDERGEALILACTVHSYAGFHDGAAVIMRRNLDNGRLQWIASFNSQVTALVTLAGISVVIFSLNDGHIGAIQADTGELLAYEEVDIEGATAGILSLASRGSSVAAGTADGRIIVYDVR